MRDQKRLPHQLVPELLKLHDAFSTFASHADAASFVHRIKATDKPDNVMLTMEYFQFARNETERKIHTLTLFHTFVTILDIFSDFVVTEQEIVPEEWRGELHALGEGIERQHDTLKAALPTDIDPFIRDME